VVIFFCCVKPQRVLHQFGVREDCCGNGKRGLSINVRTCCGPSGRSICLKMSVPGAGPGAEGTAAVRLVSFTTAVFAAGQFRLSQGKF
jgi:hypothetical protein